MTERDEHPATREPGATTPADLLASARQRERAQSRSERRAVGQFSTPVPVARALVEWAVQPGVGDAGPDDRPRVLDPATGSGVFALAAVERLRSLADEPSGSAAERVTAVEVDPDALAQARAALPPGVDTVEADFLDCGPADLGRFDAVVGNPPYVRQEGIDDGARDHLAAFGPDGDAPYLDGDRAIDRRSDAYVYFLTAATRLLRPGGRLAMVVPTKWLATRYGETLQRFLLDQYDLDAVVGFDDRTFDDALVDAALLCGTRRRVDADSAGADSGGADTERTDSRGADTERTDSRGPTRFCRVADEADLTGVLGGETRADRELAVERGRLEAQVPGKLAHLLDAPPAAVDLLDADALVPLGNLATPAYGHKTGANEFFFDPAVDERFRAPAVTSFQAVDGVALDGPPATVLDVHDQVRRVAAGDSPVDPDAHDSLAAATLAALDAEGYGDTADYVRSNREYAERSTCAARRVWFDLGPLDRPEVLHPKFFDERVAVVANRAGCVPSNAIDCLHVDDDVPTAPLLGALNATLHALALECWGRGEGGGALQLMTYELERVPVLDVRALGDDERERLADGFELLAAGEAGAREQLDRAVLDAAGVDVTPDELRTMRATLVDRRTNR